MSRKEILDAFFKLSFVVIAICVILILYNNSQLNRYKRIDYSDSYTVFDTCTGKSYAFATLAKIKSEAWFIYTPGEATQLIAYTDGSDGKKPVKIRDDTKADAKAPKGAPGQFWVLDDPPSVTPPKGRFIIEDDPAQPAAPPPAAPKKAAVDPWSDKSLQKATGQAPAPVQGKTMEKKQEGKGPLKPNSNRPDQ